MEFTKQAKIGYFDRERNRYIMKSSFLKVLSIALATLIFCSLISLPTFGYSDNGDSIVANDPVILFDEYSSRTDIKYASNHVLLLLDPNNDTVKSTVFAEVYSLDYCRLNEERKTNQIQATDTNETDIENISCEYAESVDTVREVLGTSIRFKKLEMINPNYDSRKNNHYIVKNGQNDAFLMELEEGVDLKTALIELNNNPMIKIAEPDYIRVPTLTPDDEYYLNGQQWGISKTTINGAWNRSTGNSNVVVGVLDTGIDGTHPDLVNNLWNNPTPNQNGFVNDIHGYDFIVQAGGIPYDRDTHGTHVAGIIGAEGDNEIGVAGVNWKVSLAWLAVGDAYGFLDSSIIKALSYCNNYNIQITNNSYGGAAYSLILKHAIENYNGLFIAAAGNSNQDTDTFKQYPSCYDLPNIISVGAIDRSGHKAEFSNFGEETVDVFAPGVNIVSTLPNGNYGADSGTSMACPFVTGLAALIKAKRTSFSLSDIKDAICNTVTSNNFLINKCKYGGYIDGEMAIYYSTNTRTVTFNTNYGIPTSFTRIVSYGEPVPEPDFPIRSNYYFDGWYQSGETNPFDFDTPITSNITLIAKWELATSGSFGAEFPDYAFRSFVISYLNSIDSGSRVSSTLVTSNDEALLHSVLSMDISSRGVESLDGIDYYDSLTSLNCSDNKIQTIPSTLYDTLEELNCSANRICSLSIPASNSIVSLICSGNNISSLSLTNPVALEYLDCGDNNLQSINIPSANCITHLLCNGNMLSSFNIADYPSLEVLDISSNSLSSLSISYNTTIHEIKCMANMMGSINIDNNPNLSIIDCAQNRLTSLYVCDNNSLERLNCSHNRLTSFQVNNNNNNSSGFKELDCSYNYLSSIPSCTYGFLMSLICSHNNITYLSVNPAKLVNLDCSYNQISSINLPSFVRMETINCSGNPLTSLYLSTKIRSINCSSCQLSSINTSGFVNLENLECNDNSINTLDLSSNYKLSTLCCNNNNMERLIVNRQSLSIISCSNNLLKRLDLEDADFLREVYCDNNKLVLLDINNCPSLETLETDYNYLREFIVDEFPSSLLSITYNEIYDLSGIPNLPNYIKTPQRSWSNPFSDVSSGTELYYDVRYVYENGIMYGESSTLFSPNTLVTRQQFAVILYRREGSPSVSGITIPFTDVPNNNSEGTNAIKWAYSNGIVNGTSSTTFSPNAYIIRQDLAVMIGRYIDNVLQISLPVYQAFDISSTYSDYNQISSYAKAYVRRLYESRILCGISEHVFSPSTNANKRLVASTQYRIFVVED